METSARVICSFFLIASFVCVASESYTNLAGKVIVATPVKVEGGQVTFRRELGNRMDVKLPLSIFSADEQKRIKAAAGIREMPGELKGLAAEIASQCARYEARAKAGKLSQEKLAENREMLAGSWRHAVEVSNLSPEDKVYWKAAF